MRSLTSFGMTTSFQGTGEGSRGVSSKIWLSYENFFETPLLPSPCYKKLPVIPNAAKRNEESPALFYLLNSWKAFHFKWIRNLAGEWDHSWTLISLRLFSILKLCKFWALHTLTKYLKTSYLQTKITMISKNYIVYFWKSIMFKWTLMTSLNQLTYRTMRSLIPGIGMRDDSAS